MPQPLTTVVIRRREPFEVVILALLFITAVTQLLVKAQPGSIAALIPGWYAIDWSVLTILGTGIALIGIWTPDMVTGLFMERLGINVTSLTLAIYGGAVAVFGKAQGLSALCLIIAGIYAFWMRRNEITKTIKRIPRDASSRIYKRPRT